MDAEQKKVVIDAHAKHEGDTGSPEVQVALLTARIEGLTGHYTKATPAPRKCRWPC